MEIYTFYDDKKMRALEAEIAAFKLRKNNNSDSHTTKEQSAKVSSITLAKRVSQVVALFARINPKIAISSTILLFMSFCFAFLFQYLGTFVRPVSFAYETAADINFIDSAMREFAVPTNPDVFDKDGNVSSMNEAQETLFTMPVTFRTYTVKKFDNITNITKAAGLNNISTIIGVNNISNVRNLQEGQKIQIPSVDGLFHTVKRNESLNSIADTYGIEMENLLDVNDLASSVIHAGTKLFVPNARLDSVDLRLALGDLFISPLNVRWRLTSSYGYRNDPFTGVRSFHTGMDMAAPHGTPVQSVMEGRIARTGYNNTYGNYIIVSHPGGYQTLYAHLSSILVKSGQSVSQGKTIGRVGNTGYSTGPHLHLTVYKNGKMMNPATLLR